MRLACTSQPGGLSVVQMPSVSLLTLLMLHCPNHQPHLSCAAQLPPGHSSLSLSGVLNIFPLELKLNQGSVVIRALPASPPYPATVSWYLPTSSLMENVEYSAEYHRPEVRWIYSQTHTKYGCTVIWATNHLGDSQLGDTTLITYRRQCRKCDISIRCWPNTYEYIVYCVNMCEHYRCQFFHVVKLTTCRAIC